MSTPPIVSKFDSIYKLYATVVSIRETDGVYIAFDKDGNEVSINMEDVNADFTANQEYKNKRHDEYPSVVDQLDKIYHDGIDAWKVDIKAIKDKYPKG
tara:strand:- start:254 stop:547 length:294 start_codon:yes stop_codon:yes gene_type:complete